jgi:hypothetical protein
VDSDNDTVPDEEEGYGDTDSDFIPDSQDTDSDNDGLLDQAEAAAAAAAQDMAEEQNTMIWAIVGSLLALIAIIIIMVLLTRKKNKKGVMHNVTHGVEILDDPRVLMEAGKVVQMPVRRGTANFDRISVKIYKDNTAKLEALKAGEFDLMRFFSAGDWARRVDGPKFRTGELVKGAAPENF